MARKTKKSDHPWRRRLYIALGVAVLFVGLGVAFRNPIASAVAKPVLASQQLQCDHVSIHVGLSVVRMDPTRCVSTRAPLHAVRFDSPVWVHLAGPTIAYVSVDSIQIDLDARRESDVDLNTTGDLAHLAGADQPAVDLMFTEAALSARPLPPFVASNAVVRRGGVVVARLHDMRVKQTDAGMRMTSPRMTTPQAQMLGEASVISFAVQNRVRLHVAFSSMRVDLDAHDLREHPAHVDFHIHPGGDGHDERRASVRHEH